LSEPEKLSFPSIAFKAASWFWRENAYVIRDANPAKKSNLNELADGTYINFVHLTHSLTTNLQSLKERTIINDKIINELRIPTIKRGQGIPCESSDKTIGYAVPVCLLDLPKPYCGCEGQYERTSCPHGRLNNGQCRNSATIKCCVEICKTHLDLVILMDSSGSIGATDFKKEQRFVKDLVNNLEIGANQSRVSIINFNSNAQILIDFSSATSKAILNEVVDNIKYRGGTRLFY
jgi:hypothetical protein